MPTFSIAPSTKMNRVHDPPAEESVTESQDPAGRASELAPPKPPAHQTVARIVDGVARSYALTLLAATAAAGGSGWVALHFTQFGVVLALSTAFLGFLVAMGVLRGTVVRPLLARACEDISAVMESASVEVTALRESLTSDDARALFDRIMVAQHDTGSATS